MLEVARVRAGKLDELGPGLLGEPLGGLQEHKTTADSSVPNILASHSLNADALTAHVRLYRTIMYGESRLWRSEREAIAVCVSAANGFHY